jgi:hypothetical protein
MVKQSRDLIAGNNSSKCPEAEKGRVFGKEQLS